MTNDLANDFVGATVVSFGSAFLRDQTLGAQLLELLSKLKIALATEAELLRRGLGSQFTFPFDQHGQAAGELIVFGDE